MKLLLLSFVSALVVWIAPGARACTAFFVTGTGNAIEAKNMDWSSGQGVIYVNKRDIAKQGVFVAPNDRLSWESRLMSVTYTETGRDFPWEGMNEAGLSVHALQLLASAAPPATDPRPEVEMLQWMQYMLDTAGSVDEAVAKAKEVRVGPTTTLHYFLCDSTSQCAVLEYLNGALVVHRTGPDLPYPALANDSYADSVAYLESALAKGSPTSVLTNPSYLSLDRFARAALWSKNYDPSEKPISYAFAGLRNAWEASTYWMQVNDLKSRIAYVSTKAAVAVKWTDLSEFQPGCSSGTQMLDLNAQIVGDASASFIPYSTAGNQALVDEDGGLSAQSKAVIRVYPETDTRCTE